MLYHSHICFEKKENELIAQVTELKMESLHSQDDLVPASRCLSPPTMENQAISGTATDPISPNATTATTWDMGKMMASQPSTDTNNPFRW